MFKMLLLVFSLTLFLHAPLLSGAPHAIPASDTAGCEDLNRAAVRQDQAMLASTEELVSCPETRPEVCSQDYRPVCAVLQDGSFKTYANGCNACADPAVTGYREGACE